MSQSFNRTALETVQGEACEVAQLGEVFEMLVGVGSSLTSLKLYLSQIGETLAEHWGSK